MTREAKLKLYILSSGFHCYEVADAVGIAPCTLSVWLRAPLSKEHEKKIRGAVQGLKEARCGGVCK